MGAVEKRIETCKEKQPHAAHGALSGLYSQQGRKVTLSLPTFLQRPVKGEWTLDFKGSR